MNDRAVAIPGPNGPCRLKWHRARLRATDAPFLTRRIAEGMARGASVEIDIVNHAGAGFAVLHNIDLPRETSGQGSVRDLDAGALAALVRRAPDGRLTDEPVDTLARLMARLAATAPPHPDALLQLDLKDHGSEIHPGSYAAFTEAVRPLSRHLILSGEDRAALRRLGRELPDLRIGYDPCSDDEIARLRRDRDFRGFGERALAAMPEAAIIYIAREIVLAAAEAGTDLPGMVRAAGRGLDAYTLRGAGPEDVDMARRLAALGVTQITADDPEGLGAALNP